MDGHGLVRVVRARRPVVGRHGDRVDLRKVLRQVLVDHRFDVGVQARTDPLPERARTLDPGLRPQGLDKAARKKKSVF